MRQMTDALREAIGVSAVVFSVFDTLLIRPLPFRDPGKLVWIANDGVVGLSTKQRALFSAGSWRERCA